MGVLSWIVSKFEATIVSKRPFVSLRVGSRYKDICCSNATKYSSNGQFTFRISLCHWLMCLNPRTFNGAGWMPPFSPPHKVFSKFWKDINSKGLKPSVAVPSFSTEFRYVISVSIVFDVAMATIKFHVDLAKNLADPRWRVKWRHLTS